MTIMKAGSVSYRLLVVERDGRWVAHAEREDTRRPFGIDCSGATKGEAVDRLNRWLEWQDEHAAALAELQTAQRAYHRAVTGAFASHTEGPAALDVKQETLAALDAARLALDHIRSRKPEASS
jgi:hypothetical protein